MKSPFYDIYLAAATMKANVTIDSIIRDAAQEEFERRFRELIDGLALVATWVK